MIDFGIALTTGHGCRFEVFSDIKRKLIVFGHYVQINDFVHISAMEGVYIGNNVLMASHIYQIIRMAFIEEILRWFLMFPLFKDLILFLPLQ